MEALISLFKATFGQAPKSITEILCAVSTRRYFRLELDGRTFIGTFSPDIKETIAFITFAKHFYTKGINVPDILAVSEDHNFYIQSDLGDQRLHELIVGRPETALRSSDIKKYKRVIDELVRIQIEGYEGLDFSISVPRPSFDAQAILWDLNHFKYYFLKPLGIPYDENLLEKSFKVYAEYLADIPSANFMFRDFQTRNIMMVGEDPYFIDFQGGRMGPLQYDLASLVFEAKTGLLENDRKELVRYYMSVLQKIRSFDEEEFLNQFSAVALIRILQVLGTYGLRGLVEKKAVFIQSIPNGLKNLDSLLKQLGDGIIDKYFLELLEQVAEKANLFPAVREKFGGLTIEIVSFSYRKALPDDISGNGGGFVYDCRFLNNPGLHEALKNQTGLDEDVKDFLKKGREADVFVEGIKTQLFKVIESYQDRNYSSLMLSFGCTGGRHRSVYSARAIADWCRQMTGVRVFETHREIGLEF